ncbi:biotin carboxylase [Synechococcus sp. PCC 6312]|nr:biotin carboxylase [Synechococcus sp. PCC 6312]
MGLYRLPNSLLAAGFKVFVLSPVGASVLSSSAVQGYRLLSFLKPGRKFIDTTKRDLDKAIDYFKIDFIIPGDELAVALMQRVYRLDGETFPNRHLLRDSLGETVTDGITYSKVYINRVVEKLNINMPKKFKLNELNAVNFPVVLKKAVGHGGDGVLICANEKELKNGLKNRNFCKPSIIKKLARELLGRNTTWLLDADETFIEEFLPGTGAVTTGVAFDGEIKAIFTCKKVEINDTGHAIRVKHIEAQEAEASTRKLLGELKFTGLFDIDFIFDNNKYYFIELNPRPSPISSIGHFFGVDLCKALAGLDPRCNKTLDIVELYDTFKPS